MFCFAKQKIYDHHEQKLNRLIKKIHFELDHEFIVSYAQNASFFKRNRSSNGHNRHRNHDWFAR